MQRCCWLIYLPNPFGWNEKTILHTRNRNFTRVDWLCRLSNYTHARTNSKFMAETLLWFRTQYANGRRIWIGSKTILRSYSIQRFNHFMCQLSFSSHGFCPCRSRVEPRNRRKSGQPKCLGFTKSNLVEKFHVGWRGKPLGCSGVKSDHKSTWNGWNDGECYS